MLVPVQKKRVYEDVSAQIQQQIEDGIWPEGGRIQGELELAGLFQVSRGSIREAIKSLQLMGILEARNGRGTYVAPNALQKIRDARLISMINDASYRDQVLECRYLIEPQAAFIAARICTEEDLDNLRGSYREMMAASEAGDVRRVNQWGLRFHAYLIDMMKNQVLSTIYHSMERQLLDDREEFTQEHADRVVLSFHQEHLDLIRALERRDSVLARKIMDQHLGRQMHWKKPLESVGETDG